ncbi:MAG: hypothetical protein R3F59_01655 [Myxococcota bacterium]
MQKWTVLVAAAAAGCGGGRVFMPCGGHSEALDVAVEMVEGVPVFDWAPGTASVLAVSELDDDDVRGREVWRVQCGGDNLEDAADFDASVCIRTPIAYGDVVSAPGLDTVSSTSAEPLTPGRRYVLRIDTMSQEDAEVPQRERPGWLAFLAGDGDGKSDRDDPNCGSAFTAEVPFEAPDPDAVGG